jgi:hypothetical protein
LTSQMWQGSQVRVLAVATMLSNSLLCFVSAHYSGNADRCFPVWFIWYVPKSGGYVRNSLVDVHLVTRAEWGTFKLQILSWEFSVIGERTYYTASTPNQEPTQPPIQWVWGTLSPGGIRWQAYEAGHSPPSSAKADKVGTIPPLHMFLWHNA